MGTKSSKGVKRKSGSIASVVRLNTWRSFGTRVHSKQIGSADILAFTLERLDNGRPCRRRDASALAPLGDGPVTLTDVVRHGGDRSPNLEKLSQGSHTRNLIAVDGLSSQARTIGPVTAERPAGTIRPMGRGSSPSQFRGVVAKRLEAARVGAGYDRQEDFAKVLGCGLDAYRKYEQGRTLLPAHYLPRLREITGKDANYLFAIKPTPPVGESRKETG
jgi:hypothetical protein